MREAQVLVHNRRFVLGRRSLLAALLLVLALSGCATSAGARRQAFRPQPGDLLFQELDGNPFFDAVAKVTRGHRGAALTHVGVVALDPVGEVVVLEALTEGVVATRLESFLARSHDERGDPRVLVGRLDKEYRRLIPEALTAAFALVGRPYDSLFEIDNGAYYCAELVHVVFRDANEGEPLFLLEPMTFADPNTGETFPVWEEYFEELQAPVPEGRPGLNPGGMSRAPELQIVHAYGMVRSEQAPIHKKP